MQSPQAFYGRPIIDSVVIDERTGIGTTDAAEGNSPAVELVGYEALCAQVLMTAGDELPESTLDVYLQTTIDGTNWIDVIHFTQLNGEQTGRKLVSKICGAAAEATCDITTSLDAGHVRNIFGSLWRVRWVLAGGGGVGFGFQVCVAAM